MKRFFLLLALASIATPLFANDAGADGVTIPPIGELIREGYGPPVVQTNDISGLMFEARRTAAKPTQAYRDTQHHCTIYYGFKAVPVNRIDTSEAFAFGYPLDFFQKLIPSSMDQTCLDTLAVAVYDNSGRAHHVTVSTSHGQPVTTVTPAKSGQ